MRPIRLTMSAFGPYAQETTLDFSELTGQRLFVITGPTGSGRKMHSVQRAIISLE